MRFRLALLVGFAIGYVLGAKAGRERYEQLQQLYQQVSGSKPAQQISAEVRDAASRTAQTLEEKATEGVNKVTNLARRESGDGGSSVPPTPPNTPPAR